MKAFQRGQKPTVMLVGLNPTLTKKQAHTVFELDNEDSAIYKYITHDVLKRTGLKLDDIYATNLVKCTFPSNQEPRSICQKVFGRKDNETIKKFLLPFFGECKKYFRPEIREINPKIVISFGELPHQLIVEEFDLQSQNVDKDMKKAFMIQAEKGVQKKKDVNSKKLVYRYLQLLRPIYILIIKGWQ